MKVGGGVGGVEEEVLPPVVLDLFMVCFWGGGEGEDSSLWHGGHPRA